MAAKRHGWQRRGCLALFVVLTSGLSFVVAQTEGGFNEREVKNERIIGDQAGIWVLNFKFKDPRLITVDIPGRGRRLCWYLWYQVINNTGQPRSIIPDFELVVADKEKPATYHDQVLPKVQEAIQKIEDPTGRLNIKNSVTIAAEPIPASKQDAFPRAVTGVAIWDDVNPEANYFSIFVSGLSNGWVLSETPSNQPVIRRKTLQLNFKRVGDKFSRDSRDIEFVPPAQWIYRGSLKTPDATPAKTPEAPNNKSKQPVSPLPK